ncbi:MAG TPA: hypothetical protein VMV86_01235 [Methanosarcinales archaeon]|nr:hypothetical protein [Methanosarcinales archaeon]
MSKIKVPEIVIHIPATEIDAMDTISSINSYVRVGLNEQLDIALKQILETPIEMEVNNEKVTTKLVKILETSVKSSAGGWAFEVDIPFDIQASLTKAPKKITFGHPLHHALDELSKNRPIWDREHRQLAKLGMATKTGITELGKETLQTLMDNGPRTKTEIKTCCEVLCDHLPETPHNIYRVPGDKTYYFPGIVYDYCLKNGLVEILPLEEPDDSYVEVSVLTESGVKFLIENIDFDLLYEDRQKAFITVLPLEYLVQYLTHKNRKIREMASASVTKLTKKEVKEKPEQEKEDMLAYLTNMILTQVKEEQQFLLQNMQIISAITKNNKYK